MLEGEGWRVLAHGDGQMELGEGVGHDPAAWIICASCF
jgi:hypothetical protein